MIKAFGTLTNKILAQEINVAFDLVHSVLKAHFAKRRASIVKHSSRRTITLSNHSSHLLQARIKCLNMKVFLVRHFRVERGKSLRLFVSVCKICIDR